MEKAKQLLDEFDTQYAADHYAADKILEKLKQRYKNSKNEWIQAQIQLRTITIGEAFKRNTQETLFEPKLLAYFEKNNLKYECAAIMLSRINFLLNQGNLAQVEKYLLEMRDKNLTEVTNVVSFVYHSHWANYYGRKDQHTQRLSVCLKAFQKLQNTTNHDSEWYRFFLLFSSILIDIYVSNEEFELAAPYINPALEVIEEQNVNWTHKTYARTAIAEYYAAQKDFPNALKHYNIAKKSINSNDYAFIYLHVCNSLAREGFLWYNIIPASQKRKRAELLQEIESNILTIENHKDLNKFPILQIVIPTNRGKLALLKKDYAEAIKQFTIAQQLTEKSQMNIYHYTLGNLRMQHTAYYEWWRQTKDEKKLELAYEYAQKVKGIIEAEVKEKIKNRMEAVRGYYELEQKKLNEELLRQQVEAMNKELEMANLHLHEKVMVLDDLKKHIHELKRKDPEARQIINTIDKKIDAVKITEQEKAILHKKMSETGKHFSKILAEKYPSLTNHEIQMCALFKTGITDKELAKLYGQTERAYRQQRYRIKKKMGLSEQENLVKHLTNLSVL